MNSISFIFAHNQTDKWSTPLAVVNEFKRLGWSTKTYSLLNSNNDYVDTNVRELLRTKPDIIMHMDWGQHHSIVLHDLRSTGAYLVMESGDDPQRFHDNLIKAQYFDLILSPDSPSTLKYREMGFNAYWWNHFADTKIYKPLNLPTKYSAVCSRGMNLGATIIDRIANKLPHDVCNQNGWMGDAHNTFLNSGKIVLQQSRHGEITRRIFEGMAAGKLVLTDRLNVTREIDRLFVENQEIVYYNSEIECVQKISYYCSNDEERERIARNGYIKTLENHTVVQRVEFIVSCWKRARNYK